MTYSKRCELPENLIKRFIQKDRMALSKLISLVENNDSRVLDSMSFIYSLTGKAYVIGVTGPPGAGKSTLVDKLIRVYREKGLTVGVICIDPSSIFGGAFLGDRIRMQWAYRDDGVYLRSLATRGELGGLAPSVSEIIKILDAFGKDIIIVETVGVGQIEADIINYADTKVVVSVPGLGDQMQALKGGILEIADVLVVNKADVKGAANLVDELQMMLYLRKDSDWAPEIVLTEALNNKGTEDLYYAIERHKEYLFKSGNKEQQEQKRRNHACKYALQEKFNKLKLNAFNDDEELKSILRKVKNGIIDPYKGADVIANKLLKNY